MAAALLQLVAVDNPFGDERPPFEAIAFDTTVDEQAGSPNGPARQGRELSPAERSAIEAAFGPYGPVRWVQGVQEPATDSAHTALIRVGEPGFLGETTALIGASLYCGSLCGVWLTYRLELSGGVWVVTGTEGPLSIS